MQTRLGKAAGVLYQLMKINYDRIEGYRKAASKVSEPDLKSLFRSMINESKRNASDLLREMGRSGGYWVEETQTWSATFYQLWSDFASLFSGWNRQSILTICENREYVAQAAYREAISSNALPSRAKQLIRNQELALRVSHDIIRTIKEGQLYTQLS